jgi:hypothetical protein
MSRCGAAAGFVAGGAAEAMAGFQQRSTAPRQTRIIATGPRRHRATDGPRAAAAGARRRTRCPRRPALVDCAPGTDAAARRQPPSGSVESRMETLIEVFGGIAAFALCAYLIVRSKGK